MVKEKSLALSGMPRSISELKLFADYFLLFAESRVTEINFFDIFTLKPE